MLEHLGLGPDILPGTFGRSADTPTEVDYDLLLTDVAPLSEADPGHLSFFHNSAYAEALRTTRAGAVFVTPDAETLVPAGVTRIVVQDPYRCFGQAATLFHPPTVTTETIIDPSAQVSPDAQLGAGVNIGPFVHIGAGAQVGAGSVLQAHVSIGENVRLGRDCIVCTGASLSHALVGDRAHIKPGARVGQSGFGWALGQHRDGYGLHQRIPQLGRVILGDDVEIGANATVDRGSGPDTVIGTGTVIDNHCLIAHNVRIGQRCVMAGFSGVAGSGILEDDVVVGARVSILGHIRVGAGTVVMAGSQVTKSFPGGMRLSGVPATEHRQYLREQATLRQLAQQQPDAGTEPLTGSTPPVNASQTTAQIPTPISDKGDTTNG